jgi:hypothetical protein
MKAIILAVILSFFLTGTISAEEPAISQIRKEYQAIRNTLPTLKVESVEVPEPSSEGGELKAYRDSKGNIRLIRMELYFESGKEIEEYYYHNNLLIFTLYEEYRYNVPMNVTPEVTKEIGGKSFDPKKTSVTANRYYFNNGKLIRWLDTEKKEININSKEFKDAEKNVLESSNKLRAKFK